ncbi:YheC/YheD family protein [Bacillus salipaludis]|uniref:YheC/YheD family protein n=1 Tax=Bacillus salipaludis TaxID=2547811 RepID=A0A4R5VZT6_9BACI|nr:YheC/YheD family protein [Bacillus salipaludis]MDQ6596351.1 YheC/YheD family protein [Bacillus salipaludis]TDK65166.1 YheC/YheD family protein [Bacillus salipaludis]
MSLILTKITITPRKPACEDDNHIYLSNQLFKKLHLQRERELILSLGKQTIKTKIQMTEMAANEISLSEVFIQDFCLPVKHYNFQAKFDVETHTLFLGPIIGLLTDFNFINQEEPNFRSIHTFCEELHHGISEAGGFFYVFSDEEFSNKGYYLEEGKWVPTKLPLPDVVYNRIHSRKREKSSQFGRFREKIDQLKIPIFNDRFLSKWDVHEQLIQENSLHSYIPETKIFTKENLEEFTQKYDMVFIKPIHGSQGKNIFRLTHGENGYSLKTSIKAVSNKILANDSIENIYKQIKMIQGNRIYIIQQGIHLMMRESCPMDFRALCHKNIENNWSVTSLVARISHEEEFVSNIAKGGRIMKPLQALSTGSEKEKAAKIILQMKKLSIDTATTICQYSPGITGELGIDIGVDNDGKLWLIEVNSKPSKNFEDGNRKIRPSAKAIIRFCTKLTFEPPLKKEE